MITKAPECYKKSSRTRVSSRCLAEPKSFSVFPPFSCLLPRPLFRFQQLMHAIVLVHKMQRMALITNQANAKTSPPAASGTATAAGSETTTTTDNRSSNNGVVANAGQAAAAKTNSSNNRLIDRFGRNM